MCFNKLNYLHYQKWRKRCFSVQRYQEKHQKGVIAFRNNKKSIKIYIFLCLYRNGTAFSNFIPKRPKNPYRYVSKYKRHVLLTLYRNGLYRNVVQSILNSQTSSIWTRQIWFHLCMHFKVKLEMHALQTFFICWLRVQWSILQRILITGNLQVSQSQLNTWISNKNQTRWSSHNNKASGS